MTFSVSTMGVSSVRGVAPSAARHGATGAPVDETAEAFLSEARKTPAERTREAVLKRHGVSQEDFDRRSPEQQTSIRQEVEAEMKRKLGRAQGGAFADVVV